MESAPSIKTSNSTPSLLRDPTVVVTLLLIVMGAAGLWWQFRTVSNELVETMALQQAQKYSRAITQFRKLYTSEVVKRAGEAGLEITHNYKDRPGAIPLPATLSILLGNQLEKKKGAAVRLYSDFPFPWRVEEGVHQDTFEQEALQHLKQNPESPYFQFTTLNGQMVLRYATADRMQPSCVNCHNSHPDSPKTDWKTGDVRGVLEVIQPLENAVAEAKRSLEHIFLYFLGIVAVGVSGVVLLVSRLRRISGNLEHQVRERTKEILQVNQSLEAEVDVRRQAQSAFEHLSERNEGILQSAGEGIYGLDVEGKTTFVNQAALRMLGYQSEEIIGEYMHSLIHYAKPDGSPYPQELCPMLKSFRDGGTYRVDDEVLWRKDGRSFPVAYTSTPILDNDQLIGAVITFADISERIRAQKELQEAYLFTDRLLFSITSILIAVDREDCITRWNRYAEETFQILADEVLGKPFVQTGLQLDLNVITQAIYQCMESRASIRIEELEFTPPSAERPRILGLTVNPIVEKDETVSGFLILGTDITERKLLQVQLSIAQKMESIGQLAAGIAHEINTPIQFVNDNLKFLQDSFQALDGVLMAYGTLREALSAGSVTPAHLAATQAALEDADLEYVMEEIPKAIQQSQDGADRVAKIVRAMKEFSHPGTSEQKLTDFNKAIENAVTVARNEWKYVADIEFAFDPDLPLVSCLPGEMNQVILNMVVNAAHAIRDVLDTAKEDKGKVTIRTRQMGDWVEIDIADTGSGMPKEVQEKIFDPFFTTKEVGKGTGQGLAIAHDVVVNKHAGTIAVDSQMGEGTTFTIRLPLSESEAALQEVGMA